MSADTRSAGRRSGRPGIRAVARHLWGSPVHAAAVDLLDPQAGERVVDLGAGLGPATMHIARRVGAAGSVTAVDPSRVMRVAVHGRRIVHPARSSIVVRDGTAEDLPAGTDSIDAVVGLNVAHLLRDVELAAAEIARALRTDGRVLFVEEDIDDPSHTFHHATPHAPDGPTLDELSAALIDAGLRGSPPRHRHLGGQPAYSIAATVRHGTAA